MRPTVTVDTSEFQKALRQHLATTSRDLQTALDMRLAYVLWRTKRALAPLDIQAQRAAVRNYLMEVIETRGKVFRSGKRKGEVNQAREHIRAHRIVQAGRSPGLYGADMKRATRQFISKTVKSIGYMKAALANAMSKVIGVTYVTKDGKRSRVYAKRFAAVKAEARAVRPAASSKSTVTKGGGWNPFVQSETVLLKVGAGQEGKVNSLYLAAINQGMAEELEEMKRHMAAKILDNAEAAGFQVK